MHRRRHPARVCFFAFCEASHKTRTKSTKKIETKIDDMEPLNLLKVKSERDLREFSSTTNPLTTVKKNFHSLSIARALARVLSSKRKKRALKNEEE